jgi:hypothetical protein
VALQEIGIDFLMKPLELLTLQAQVFGASRKQAQARAHELLEEGLVSLDKKTTGLIVELSASGWKLAQELDEHEDCLRTERAFFGQARRIPEHKIQELLNGETDL